MINRTLVALKSTGENNFSVAKFVDCIVHHFEANCISVPVKCKLENNLLKLSPVSSNNKPDYKSNQTSIHWDKLAKRFMHTSSDNDHVILQHSPECPIANLSRGEIKTIPIEIYNRGIHVAVSILLESKDSKILMTKRPEHMRTFPRAWVPPGGHIEHKESLIDAGLRELHEETGLTLDEDANIQILCLWESVYPVLLGLGSPVRHHVVVYLLARVNSSSEQLLTKIKLDPEEVQACTWLNIDSVKFLLAGGKGEMPEQDMWVLQEDKQLKTSMLDLRTMFHASLWGQEQAYSGSQLALRCWINSLQISSTSKL